MANAIALCGAIIESINGSTMRYYRRCNSCGVAENSVCTTSCPTINMTFTSGFQCRCGARTDIKIKGL